MIISIEGLPGTRKDEIYQLLNKQGINIKSYNKEMKCKNYFEYELGLLCQITENYKKNGNIYDSIYAYKNVYVDDLYKKMYINDNEYKIINNIYENVFIQPNYIIYLFSDMNDSYKRMQDKNISGGPIKIKSIENYSELYTNYEFIFDITSCNIPIYKLNVDDNINNIIHNILYILNDINEINKENF